MAGKRKRGALGNLIGWLLNDKPSSSRKGSQRAAGKRNSTKTHRKPPKRNPSKHRNPGELEAARRMSREFHGDSGHVVEVPASQRRLPRYVVALGKVPELRYEPKPGSKRAGYTWVHKSGDRGFLRAPGKGKPTLGADPRTGKPVIVAGGMKFEPDKGLVG